MSSFLPKEEEEEQSSDTDSDFGGDIVWKFFNLVVVDDGTTGNLPIISGDYAS
jgi:hypothetical protein